MYIYILFNRNNNIEERKRMLDNYYYSQKSKNLNSANE